MNTNALPEPNTKPAKYIPNSFFTSRTFLFLFGLLAGLAITVSVMDARLRETEAELLSTYRRPQPKPDTILVHKIYRDTVRIIERHLPKTVYVYTQPDTLRRQRLEKDTLIGGIRFRPEALELERLTPKGITLLERYPLPSNTPMLIDISANGHVQITPDEATARRLRRKRRWNRVLIGVAFVVGVVVGRG